MNFLSTSLNKTFIILKIILMTAFPQAAFAFPRETLNIVVPPMHKSCFSKIFVEGVQTVFEFKVVAGGNRDIDVRVISPNGLVLYKALRTSGDEISFYAQGGDFRFCFSNEFSKMTNKRVAFNIRPFDEVAVPVVAEGVNGSSTGVKGSLETHCDNIHFLLGVVQDFQAKYMVRESAGRYLAETLQTRVDTCSLGLSLAILVAGLGQVAVFKKFFTERRASTKPVPPEEEVEL